MQRHAIVENAQHLRIVVWLRAEVEERAAVVVGYQRRPDKVVLIDHLIDVVFAHVSGFAVGRAHVIEVVLAAVDLHPRAARIAAQPLAGGTSLRAQVQGVGAVDHAKGTGGRHGAAGHEQEQKQCGQGTEA